MNGVLISYTMPVWDHSVVGGLRIVFGPSVSPEDWEIIKLLRERSGTLRDTAYNGCWVSAEGLCPFKLDPHDDYVDYADGTAYIPWQLFDEVYEDGWLPERPVRAGRWLVYHNGRYVETVCINVDYGAPDWSAPHPADTRDIVQSALKVATTMMEDVSLWDYDERFERVYENYLAKVFRPLHDSEVLEALAEALADDDENQLVIDVIRAFKGILEE